MIHTPDFKMFHSPELLDFTFSEGIQNRKEMWTNKGATIDCRFSAAEKTPTTIVVDGARLLLNIGDHLVFGLRGGCAGLSSRCQKNRTLGLHGSGDFMTELLSAE